jgi:multiple sugar transport system substrate-binding protein
MMGGWEFAIPKTSTNKDLAWELIKIILQPDVLSPWIAKQGFLPTQISMGQGPDPSAKQLRKSIPFFDDMVSMIPQG